MKSNLCSPDRILLKADCSLILFWLNQYIYCKSCNIFAILFQYFQQQVKGNQPQNCKAGLHIKTNCIYTVQFASLFTFWCVEEGRFSLALGSCFACYFFYSLTRVLSNCMTAEATILMPKWELSTSVCQHQPLHQVMCNRRQMLLWRKVGWLLLCAAERLRFAPVVDLVLEYQ